MVATKPNVNWRTFAEPLFLLVAGGMFFSFLGVYFGFVHMVSFASTELHLDATAATNLLIFMLASNLPGRFLLALMSDQCIGPLNTFIPSTLLSSAVLWLWAASGDHNRGSLTIIACFYGFVSAGIQALYAPTVYTFCLEAVPAYASTKDPKPAMDRVGLKARMILSCIGIAYLIGLPIGGALILYRVDRGIDQPYLGVQTFAGLSLLVAGCLLLSSRVAKAGWEAKRA